MDALLQERLTRVWRRGDRCVAVLDIFYAAGGLEVAQGTRGTVKKLNGAVVYVAWDGKPEGPPWATSPENLDPLPE